MRARFMNLIKSLFIMILTITVLSGCFFENKYSGDYFTVFLSHSNGVVTKANTYLNLQQDKNKITGSITIRIENTFSTNVYSMFIKQAFFDEENKLNLVMGWDDELSASVGLTPIFNLNKTYKPEMHLKEINHDRHSISFKINSFKNPLTALPLNTHLGKISKGSEIKFIKLSTKENKKSKQVERFYQDILTKIADNFQDLVHKSPREFLEALATSNMFEKNITDEILFQIQEPEDTTGFNIFKDLKDLLELVEKYTHPLKWWEGLSGDDRQFIERYVAQKHLLKFLIHQEENAIDPEEKKVYAQLRHKIISHPIFINFELKYGKDKN